VDEGGQVEVRPRAGGRRSVAVDTADAYQRSWTAALAHFAGCLTTGAQFETHGAQGLATMRIVLSGYESARTGAVVSLAGGVPL
jgi:predicted dehydrogenase